LFRLRRLRRRVRRGFLRGGRSRLRIGRIAEDLADLEELLPPVLPLVSSVGSGGGRSSSGVYDRHLFRFRFRRRGGGGLFRLRRLRRRVRRGFLRGGRSRLRIGSIAENPSVSVGILAAAEAFLLVPPLLGLASFVFPVDPLLPPRLQVDGWWYCVVMRRSR